MCKYARLSVWLTCLVISSTLLAGGVAESLLGRNEVVASTVTGSVSSTEPAIAPAAAQGKLGLQTSFASTVQRVTPSVVNIWSSRKVNTSDNRRLEPLFEDPFFRRFFGDDLFGQSPIPRERRERSLGSGVIVSQDGYVLTNAHVVDGATDIKVSLSDKREFPARLIGSDPKTDLAVIKIDRTGLPPVTLGDSSKVQVGDIALAIGNPFGLGQTVTMGVISATGRGGLGIEEYEDFIQTDAAINPGNSGGALINADGALIGINTAILSRSGGNQGVGFAIPVNMARNVMDQIIRDGKVSRAFLGVTIQPVTPDIASAFQLNKVEGALIADVAADTPAERAGLHAGDIVLKLDGSTVADSRALQLAIGQMTPGRTVRLTVTRDGRERDFSVALGEQPREGTDSTSDNGRSQSARVLDGISAETLTPELARQFGISTNVKGGVLIRRVDPSSVAAQAGLAPGDVILQVNRNPVTTVEQMNRYLSASKDSTLLFVSRDGRTRYVVIPSN